MTNIVTKLRNLAIQELKADRRAAMTENHDLWREVERLRAALSGIVEECRNTGYGDPTVMERMIDRIEETASAAMRKRKGNESFR
jgi:regulator of replication initiation timing